MDNHFIHGLKIQKKAIYKRLYAAICMLLVSSLLLTTTSFAWLTLSSAPEVFNVTTTIGANGNLEIALGKNIGESTIGDSFGKNNVTTTNKTWGNLIDLTDPSYGLQTINLRPALLNSAGGAVDTLHPLAYPIYGADGRVQHIYANNMFAGTYNGTQFVTKPDDYSVHGIGTTLYNVPGVQGTFGPLSLRQEIFYDAQKNLWSMTDDSWISLCYSSKNVLMAYCIDKTGISASNFSLDSFSKKMADVASSANEELRTIFTLLAASKTTSYDNYFMALKLLEIEYPEYEKISTLVSSAIQDESVENIDRAIDELRAFQNKSDQLKEIIDAGVINSNDGYSMEEIEQTVGLIFNLEKTSFSETSSDYWCKFISDLHYRIYLSSDKWWSGVYGLTVNNVTQKLLGSNGQDNSSRETTSNEIAHTHTYSLYRSLPLEQLDSAIAGLYLSHWNYWDKAAEEYKLLQKEITNLENQVKQLEGSGKSQTYILQLNTQLIDKKEQLQSLIDGEVFALNDERIESIRSVVKNTIETLRKYTLWSIAYVACDGQVKDDAYHRLLEIANSTKYIHPRNAYQILSSYGTQPQDNLKNMVETYEKLEQELLFLQDEPEGVESITWSQLNIELKRVFGNIEHDFDFVGNRSDYTTYFKTLLVEDNPFPIDVLKEIENEIENCVAELGNNLTNENLIHTISYEYIDANNIQPWAQALGLLNSFNTFVYSFDYGITEHILVDCPFTIKHHMSEGQRLRLNISVGVGTEDNFNESGLTQRQTKLKMAQEQISYYQNKLINAAVNPDGDMVALIMQIIAGEESVSIDTISNYLDALKQQLEYGESMMYQAALAMAFSNYASDDLYNYACSDRAPNNVVDMIALLQRHNFDQTVLNAFAHRMNLLNNQESLLNQSYVQLAKYKNPDTGAFKTKDISRSEAVNLLSPVLDASSISLYGYVEKKQNGKEDNPQYMRTVLYNGYGSDFVNINGNQVTVAQKEPVTIFGKIYLSLENSFSGAMLSLAKPKTESYSPPTGLVSADDIVAIENGMNRYSYSMGQSTNQYTLNFCTEDKSYALASDLWTYTGNTRFISADQTLVDVYGYSIDLSFRTNVESSDLQLQTKALDRIYNDGENQTDSTMGAGSFMKFERTDTSLSIDMIKEYMSCLRVVFTDTNTGYIYGYAALDMNSSEVIDAQIKAPLRLYDKDKGIMNDENEALYLCHLEKDVEKNITVYVYLDGTMVSQSFVSYATEQSLTGVLNLQFSSSVELIPAKLGTIK